MHSAASRLNNVFFFTGIVLAIMAATNYFHGRYLYNSHVDVQFNITEVTNFVRTNVWEQASVKYSLDVNLSTLYTWNLKQIYVYIQFQWKDKLTNLTSRTIVSDWIFQTPTNRTLIPQTWFIKQTNKRFQYLLRDVHFGLAGNTVKVTLELEYMPIVGYFTKSRLYQGVLLFDKKYTN